MLRQVAKSARQRRKGGDRVELGVEGMRIISGPHFDEAATRLSTKEALSRSDDLDGTARQLMAIAGSPDRTAGSRRGHGADRRDPRSGRPAGATRRRHRHRPGGARRPSRDVPRHGPRSAPTALGPDHRRDRRDEPAALRWLNPTGAGHGPGWSHSTSRACCSRRSGSRWPSARGSTRCAGPPATSPTTTC